MIGIVYILGGIGLCWNLYATMAGKLKMDQESRLLNFCLTGGSCIIGAIETLQASSEYLNVLITSAWYIMMAILLTLMGLALALWVAIVLPSSKEIVWLILIIKVGALLNIALKTFGLPSNDVIVSLAFVIGVTLIVYAGLGCLAKFLYH